MRILLVSIGTRGDCEPFLGVGVMLRSRGHEVVCSFPEQYRRIAEDAGFEFRSLGPEFLDLLDTRVAHLALGGGGNRLVTLAATARFFRNSAPAHRRMIDRQHAIVSDVRPDVMVFHPMVTYPVPWSMAGRGRAVMLSPVPCLLHPVRGHSSVGVNHGLGPLTPLTYQLVRFATSLTVMIPVNKYFPGLATRRRIARDLLRIPVAHAVSSSLFPRPPTWPTNAIVAGFWPRDQAAGFSPDPELEGFLADHCRVVFVTFGSIPAADPEGRTALFLRVLSRLGIPAIINVAGGAFAVPHHYDTSMVHFTASVPYDWAFPRVHAVVHHGGAGVTQSALRAGCATMAVPHAADQPLWDDLIHASGAGPRGIPVTRLREDVLTGKLRDLVTNPGYKAAAERLAGAMAHEDHTDQVYRFITGGSHGDRARRRPVD